MFGLACDLVGRLRLDSFDMTEPHVQIRSDVDDSAVTDNTVFVVGLSVADPARGGIENPFVYLRIYILRSFGGDSMLYDAGLTRGERFSW